MRHELGPSGEEGRQREKESKWAKSQRLGKARNAKIMARKCMCVCVCVRQRESEKGREREGGRPGGRGKKTVNR